MRTLLDFHYSDEWADPSRQNPPAAWSAITDVDELAGALGAYTTETLERFDAAGVLPDMVQIGNETNGGLVKSTVELDWGHDRPLFEAGIAAVRAISDSTGQHIDVMLHVAQPENALEWFAEADAVGLSDFDVIGMSYYPQWSRFSIAELGSAVHSLATAYDKEVLVVETGYPWTHDAAADTADNVLDQALREYEVSPSGQAAFDGRPHRRGGRQRRVGDGVLGAGVVEHAVPDTVGSGARTGRTPRCSTSMGCSTRAPSTWPAATSRSPFPTPSRSCGGPAGRRRGPRCRPDRGHRQLRRGHGGDLRATLPAMSAGGQDR